MLAAIPYHTFPEFHVGPILIRTFGLMVGIGIALGAVVAARYVDRFHVSRDEFYVAATKIVVAGLVGARVGWVVTHPSDIHSALDVIAVWRGGLEFSGGFILAVAVAFPIMARWSSLQRWRAADGIALGLTIGLAIGRIGCISVGEHLGHQTSFFLGWRYLGGVTREGPLLVGHVYQNTAIYEFLHLLVLAAVLWFVLYRRPSLPPGTAIGLFGVWYGVARFLTDFLRAYDHRVLGLTGAQYLCLLLAPAGVWVLATGRRRRDRLAAGAEPAPVDAGGTDREEGRHESGVSGASGVAGLGAGPTAP